MVLAVARRGGFAAAAGALNMSPSAVSHAVKLVEDRLGQPLFARTTRSVALTEAGRHFVASVGPALDQVEDSVERVQAARGRIAGTLRLNVPHLALPLAITPAIVALGKKHPDLTVEIVAHEGLVDIVAEGFDAGVRLGEMIAHDMIAVRITPPFRAIMVASLAYLAERGAPATIAELADHNCIGYRLIASHSVYQWDLQEDGRKIAVEVGGTVRITDSLYARDLALRGVGIAYLFDPLVRDDLKAGRLHEVLPEAAIEEPGLFLYFPRYASEAPKLRALIEALAGGRSRPGSDPAP